LVKAVEEHPEVEENIRRLEHFRKNLYSKNKNDRQQMFFNKGRNGNPYAAYFYFHDYDESSHEGSEVSSRHEVVKSALIGLDELKVLFDRKEGIISFNVEKVVNEYEIVLEGHRHCIDAMVFYSSCSSEKYAVKWSNGQNISCLALEIFEEHTTKNSEKLGRLVRAGIPVLEYNSKNRTSVMKEIYSEEKEKSEVIRVREQIQQQDYINVELIGNPSGKYYGLYEKCLELYNESLKLKSEHNKIQQQLDKEKDENNGLVQRLQTVVNEKNILSTKNMELIKVVNEFNNKWDKLNRSVIFKLLFKNIFSRNRGGNFSGR
jgi:hypothetical protein